jgi:hypothetical protein
LGRFVVGVLQAGSEEYPPGKRDQKKCGIPNTEGEEGVVVSVCFPAPN